MSVTAPPALLAALEVASGKVPSGSFRRHRHRELIAFWSHWSNTSEWNYT